MVCSGFTEAVIRLALSALVGVAVVAVVVYVIRGLFFVRSSVIWI